MATGNQLIHQIETLAFDLVHEFGRLSTTNQQSASLPTTQRSGAAGSWAPYGARLTTMDVMSDPMLDTFNPDQRVDVTYGYGPIILLAGAGTGVTEANMN